MRKLIIPVGLASTILISFLLLQTDSSEQYAYILRELNRDTVHFHDGGAAGIWLWDDKGAAAIGENAEGEVTLFHKDEYKEIEENKLLRYLKTLI